MIFSRVFTLSNHALIALGIGALVVADFLPLTALVLLAIAMAMRAWPAVNRMLLAIPRVLINTVTLLAFAWVVVVEGFLAADFIGAVVSFTVYLQFLRLLTASRAREYFQTYVLALAHLILSALLTAELVFAVPFLLFILIAPWCFTLYNLQAQAERAYGGDPAGGATTAPTERGLILARILSSRHAVTGRLFAATALLSVVILAVTTVIFAAFPRVSSGFLFRSTAFGSPVTGFSDRVDLRTFGRIKQSDALVMRVTQQAGPPLTAPDLYWRGLAYDTYNGREWLRSSRESRPLLLHPRTANILIRRGDWSRAVAMEIHLERIDTDAFFALHEVMAVQWEPARAARVLARSVTAPRQRPALAMDRYDALHFEGGLDQERIYTAYSSIERPSPAALREAAPIRSAEAPMPGYLQLPAMSKRFGTLAATLATNATTRLDGVLAVIHHLQTACTYTLNIPRPTGDPIESFLFDQPRGHCEYFASSAVLLLRAAGIPTRLVSGFRGGDWNPYGGYLTVRQRDAHTWIEVFFPSLGWIPFDPTPPDRSASGYRDMRLAGMRHILEWAELRWFNSVVNFNFQDQQRMVSGTLDRLQTLLARMRLGNGEDWTLSGWLKYTLQRRPSTGDPQPPPWPAMAATALGLALVAWLWQRRRARRGPAGSVAFYEQYLAIAARRGVRLHEGETAVELTRRLVESLPAAAPHAMPIVQLYYRQRFGAVTPTPEERRALRMALNSLAQLTPRKGPA